MGFIDMIVLEVMSMSENVAKSKQYMKEIFSYVTLMLGAMIAAFSIEGFLVPCTILDGGVVGISIMINNLSRIPLGVLTLALNFPFLIIGMRKLGTIFIAKSAVAMVTFSSFLGIFASITVMTRDYLLAVCFGGVFLGIGVGLVIRSGGCLDGTETVAIFLNRRFNLPVGQTVLFINIVIYTIAGFLFGFDRAMYSLLTYFITSKVIDFVETGVEQAKAAMIITNEGHKIADEIFKKTGRTVTILEGEGLISGKKAILYCVLNRLEIYELKHLIKEVDAKAFITISDVSEIIGNHIKKRADKDM